MHGTKGAVEAVPPTGNLALGIIPGHEFHENTIQLDVGDALFLYTDGITEACNSTDAEFGEHRLDDHLDTERNAAMGDLVDIVVKAVDDFALGMDQFDDMTCLALRWNARCPTDGASGLH